MIEFTETLARGAPRAAVRDRRRRGQGRPRSTSRSGSGSVSRAPRWAIAYKFPPEQVETVVEDIVAVRRPDRDADAGRAPDAGEGRRIDRRPGDAPQPRRGPAQGHPRRRHVVLQKAGDVIPEVVRPIVREADRRRARVGHARGVPGLRHAGRPGRGRGPPLLPEPAVPGARRPGVRALRRAGWTSRAPAGRSSSSCSSAAWSSAAATSSGSRSRTSRALDRFARKSAENLYAAIQKARRRPLERMHRVARHPAGRLDDGDRARAVARGRGPARPGERLARRRRGAQPAPSGRDATSPSGSRRSRASGRGRRAALAAWFAPAARARASSRTSPTRASRPSCRRRGPRRRPRAARGQDGRRHRARSRASAARRPRRRSARPAESRRARCRRRPTTSSPARAPAPSSRRRRSSASRCSMPRASGAAGGGEHPREDA